MHFSRGFFIVVFCIVSLLALFVFGFLACGWGPAHQKVFSPESSGTAK
jgi:hypothetical protein